MPKYNNTIPFEGEYKRAVAEGIVDGTYLFQEHLRAENFPTDNGCDMHLWNYINRAVSMRLPNDRFQVVVMHRGRWGFLGIYDNVTKYLYTMMRDENFKRLHSDAVSHRFHYLNVLSGLNEPLKESYDVIEEQLCLFPDLEYNDQETESLKSTLNKLVMQIDGEIECYVLVTFSAMHGQVVSLKGTIPARGMDYFSQENWEAWITPNYDVLDREWVESETDDSGILLQRTPELKRLKHKKNERKAK